MSSQRRHRTMNQCPPAVDSTRQQCGILVFWRHDHAESLKALEVFGKSQRNSGTATRKRCICHSVLFELRDVRDTGIFNAPYFLRKFARVCSERRFLVDTPFIDPVGRTRGAKMRKTTTVLHAAEKQRVSVG